jgi:diacylglycerol kinase family enzyme
VPRALPVIVNAAAGKGYRTEDFAALRDAFEAAGLEADILPARDGPEVVAIAERAVKEGHPVIVAGGGDGTVSTVASLLARSGSALGVLPLGTLNHFAKDLRIPLELTEAARVIAANREVRVDVGEVNGRIFINNSSLGLYPTLVIHRELQRRRLGRGKWHALFWATLTVLRRHPMLAVRLCLDDAIEDRRTPLVFIGNNEYNTEGFDIGTRARLDAGRLSIYLIKRTGRGSLFGLALRALLGLLNQERDFEALHAQTIGIETHHKHAAVATDGEVSIMEMPLAYKILPGALRVIVPAPEPASA